MEIAAPALWQVWRGIDRDEEQAWIQKPSDWWDNRGNHQCCFDFRHHTTGNELRIASADWPDWVPQKVELLRRGPPGRARYSIDADILDGVKECRDLAVGKRLLSQAIDRGLLSDTRIATQFVQMLIRCGAVEDARRIFDKMEERSLVTWNLMIKAYVKAGKYELAWELYEGMEQAAATGIEFSRPNKITFIALLSACSKFVDGGFAEENKWLEKGKSIHSQVVMRDLGDIYMASSLVHFYAKCGRMKYAQVVFDGMKQPDIVAWTALIQGYTNNARNEVALQLFDAMEDGGCIPDGITFIVALSACSNLAENKNIQSKWLEKGKAIHSRAVMSNCSMSLKCSLLHFYAKCGQMVYAQEVFDEMASPDIIAWTALIEGYSNNGNHDRALELFEAMESGSCCFPDETAFSVAFSACGKLADTDNQSPSKHNNRWLEKAKSLHSQWVLSRGSRFFGNFYVESNLLHMYAKLGAMEHALVVFEDIVQPGIASWNVVIEGCGNNARSKLALEFFDAMEEQATCLPDEVTYVVAISACASLADGKASEWLEKAKAIHSRAVMSNSSTIHFENNLVHVYGRLGKMDYAQVVFNEIGTPDIVSWNTLLWGYLENRDFQQALKLSPFMDLCGVMHDYVTFAAVLKACGSLLSFQLGTAYHKEIRNTVGEDKVSTGLVDFYGRCGCMDIAKQVFDSVPHKSVWTWTALLNGYGLQRDMGHVFQVLEDMKRQNIKPDGITFICILNACSHAGLVEKGKELFSAMSREYRITPSVHHYNCMIDLLARANLLEEALKVAQNMPYKDEVVWTTILGGCEKWKNVEVGNVAYQHLVRLDDQQTAPYVLMRNIYASLGLREEEQKIEAARRDTEANDLLGETWWADKQASFIHTDLKIG